MTEIEAAMGRVQLRKLPWIVGRRRQLVAQLPEQIADLGEIGRAHV